MDFMQKNLYIFFNISHHLFNAYVNTKATLL